MGMRSGRRRHEVGRRALQLAGVLDQHHAVAGQRHLGQERVGERGLAGGGAAGDQDVAALDHGDPERFDLGRAHDAGGGVVAEGEHRDGGFADGEGGRDRYGRQQAFEALAGLGQLGGEPGRAGVDLGPDMVSDQAHDALAVVRRESLAGVGQTLGQPIDPEPSVGVEHDLDHARVFQPAGDVGAQSRAQHACAAGEGFGPEYD